MVERTQVTTAGWLAHVFFACCAVLVAGVTCLTGCGVHLSRAGDADAPRPLSAVVRTLFEEALPSLQDCSREDGSKDWSACRPGEPLVFWRLEAYRSRDGLFEQMAGGAGLALVPVLDGDRVVGEFWVESVDGAWELGTVGGTAAADLLAAKELLLDRAHDERAEVRFVTGPLGGWVAARWDGHVAGVFPHAREAQMTLGTMRESELPKPGRVYVDGELEEVLGRMR